jgi:DNA-binding Lrp family transcriptional regulator
MSDPGSAGGSWTLLTGHGHVLVEIARDPQARIRDISAVVGLTDRTVQAIVADLEAAGYLTRTRAGRRTRYTVNHDSLFRHSAQEGLRIGPLLDLLGAPGGDDGGPAETELPAAPWRQPAVASVTWRSNSAVVTGPTPPGTGLSAPATSATFGSTSPARPPSGVAFVPTSMTMVPGAT